MTTFDLTPDDEPLDLEAINADDVLVERLRSALSPEAAVVWDDDDEDDPGYALLRAVQLDVSADLPVAPILPDEVMMQPLRRRHLSRTATVAVVAASVLSIGGVAAASAPGQPLAGVRHAVSDAVASAVEAITPDSPIGPSAAKPTQTATASPSPKPTPPGDAVSDAARSAAAILQIEANLDKAGQFLDQGKTEPAEAQLDAAERKLAYVTDTAERDRLQTRLTALRARLAATPTATAHATPPAGKPDDKGRPTPTGKPSDPGANGAHNSQGAPATSRPTTLPTRHARTTTPADFRASDASRRAVTAAADRRRNHDD